MAGYTKEFLVAAFMSRYEMVLSGSHKEKYLEMVNHCYDSFGKDKFRVYAALDASAIKKYKETL